MKYRTWLKIGPDGAIVSVVWRLGDTPPLDHPVLCTEAEHEHELRKNAGRNLHFAGNRVCRRTPVRWVASPPVAAVGETIRLELGGMPAERGPVRVRIGNDVHELPPPYVIELGWENAARVGIDVADAPDLVQTAPMHVQFVERRRKP